MSTHIVKFVETALRDGQQSLTATRMHTKDMLPILEKIDNIGYHAVEAWGGATFDACLRFLDEDPWERLRLLKRNLPKTPIQMLLRGQNLLGYQHYADDLVIEFVKRSISNGVSIIRVFDALNDLRNLECSIQTAKNEGAHIQGALVYTISPYHKDNDYLHLAQELVSMGVDSICIKDMAGILAPYDAYSLIKLLKSKLTVPLEIHSHCTSGMAEMTYLKAIEAGVDIIDTALSPFAGTTSQPSTESMVAALTNNTRGSDFQLENFTEIAAHLTKIKDEIIKNFNLKSNFSIDPNVISFQLPGGMLSNLINQMQELGAADKYPELLQEMPKVRAELGYPPLVTPTSQIIASLAVMNIMFGRYKMIPNQVKDLVRGKYGHLPGPIDPMVKSLVIGDENPINYRPADELMPQLTSVIDELKIAGFSNLSMEDILSYALFPEISLTYFKKHR